MLNNTNRLFVFLLGMALLGFYIGVASAATPMVAAGRESAIALKTDGTLTAWGRNDYGQLGNGQAAMRVAPVKVEGIDNITAVAVGDSITLALRNDGTVWSWGINANGSLGDGTTQNKSHPVPVTGLSGVVKSIAIGQEHALAVTTDGNVWAWGWGLHGQLGNGGVGNSTSAINVSGLPTVVKVAAGSSHSLALADNGTVWAWGDNSMGQLGDGTTISRSIPVWINGLSNIVAISTKASSNLALDAFGRVWAWGQGGWGALGDGSYYNSSTPFTVPGLPQIASIVAGNRVSVAIDVDGSVWLWGDNETGQFGGITYGAQPSPVKVPTLSGFSDFSVGDSHVVARSLGGALQSWGGNGHGQLGVGDANDRTEPTAVAASVQFTQVSAGINHTAAVADNGSVWAWGANGSGQLGDGTVSVSNRPIDVQGPGDTVAIAAGFFHVLALSSNGSVWAWGNNPNGALGNDSRRDSALPQRISSLPYMSAIAAGFGVSLALEPDGSVWSWGDGRQGQLGNGQDGFVTLLPEKLTSISGVKQISVKYQHVLAMRQDGSVWAWGSNSNGQLGDGTTTNRSLPTRVTGLPNGIVAVSAGGFHSLALDSSGAVWAWGYNWDGQLGDGTNYDWYTPGRVIGLSDVVAISAGENISYAITRDGRIWSWGSNYEGELGTDYLYAWNSYASPIGGLADFQGIAGGVGSAVALRSDGTVWTWGSNFEGQLGDATFAQGNTPVLTLNAAANGPLDLNTLVANSIPSDKIPTFFATADRAGDLSKFTVSTTTKFNEIDVGKSGSVFVTAMVPSKRLSAAPIALFRNHASRAKALAAANSFVLMQLTSLGWEPVENGRLIPYATGVLGDKLAAQTILDGADISRLNGTEFCVGYGSSAEEMTASGRMRTMVTIPDPGSTSTVNASCAYSAISDDRVFAYAEANYPSFFPGTANSIQYPPYNYRYYSATGNYLAVGDDKVIYVYGAINGYALPPSPVGSVESFRNFITGWEATLPR